MVNYFCDTDNASVVMQQLDDRVVNMYKTIGMILRKYRSGKLPKAFKIIPALNNWEQVSTSMERCGIVVRVTIDKNLLWDSFAHCLDIIFFCVDFVHFGDIFSCSFVMFWNMPLLNDIHDT